jgi:nucleotide-binding universal stress UspA family protein
VPTGKETEMSQIVVGYDGSDCSRAALEEGLRMANALDDKVVVVFGYAPPGLWGGEIAEHEEAIEERGTKVLSEAKHQAEAAGATVELELVARKPSEAIVDVAEEREARMIVVGSYGDPPLKGMILGSTPNKLLHLAERPVLVVPASR